MRFQFKAGRFLRALLLPFGATTGRRFAELSDQSLHVKLGSLFDSTLDLDNMESVEPSTWPLIYGLGCRIGRDRKFGVLASTKNVVRIRFRELQPMPALFSMKFNAKWLYLSLEEPERFIDELGKRLDASRAG